MSDQKSSKPPAPTKDSTPADKKDSVPAPPAPVRGDLAEIIPPEVKEALKGQGIDLDDPTVKGQLIVALESAYHGPIPSPEMLGSYDRVRPGTSDQIIKWTDKQINHRMSLEKSGSKHQQDRMDRGQIIAGTVALTGIVAGALVGVFGDPVVGIAIAAIGVGGPTIGFLARIISRIFSG